MKLKDKTILITGASSGIGRAMALRAAKDKGRVILASRNKKKLDEVKGLVEDAGAEAIVIQTDVTKDDDIKNLFLEASKKAKTLDAVFDNAGLGFIGHIYELTYDQIHKMIDVNLTGMIMVAKYASEVMVRQKHGHIVMTSSLAGLITLPQWSVYVATKWGITGFADSIRFELAPHNVRITTLHPGAVKTGFFDKDKANIDISKMGDAVKPEVIADAVYDALFTDKKKIVIPRLAKNYSLLFKYLPGVVQKLIEKQAKDIEYHEDVNEDEPEFSYVKCVKC